MHSAQLHASNLIVVSSPFSQYLYLDPEYNGEVVVAWIVLVAVEIILMFIVLFLSVRRCAGRNGEANIGVGLYLTVSCEVKVFHLVLLNSHE